VNPYLRWVADVKVNQSRSAANSAAELQQLRVFGEGLSGVQTREGSGNPLVAVDLVRDYFPPGVAARVATLLTLIDETFDGWARELGRLAVSTSLVPASNMVRRTDLRRRTTSDPGPAQLDELVARNLDVLVADTKEFAPQLLAGAVCLGADARGPYDPHEPFDLVVTSPPYLNGTNYFRNSKLELLALELIRSEAELAPLRARAVTAGINNVSRRMRASVTSPEVERVALAVDEQSYDQRIGRMIRAYFSDMAAVMAQLRASCHNSASLFLDIGDSRYAGVHVPTDQLLVGLAEAEGWRLVRTEAIRERRSYDGSPLKQVLLEFRADS
jgi:hypothetical protein